MSSLRPPPVDGSSSSPESMSTAFMSANVSARLDDADMDGDHDDDDDLLLKDDSSSPSPESEKPAFVERRPPSKFPPGASRRIPNTQGGRSASSVAKTSKGPRASSGASSSKNRASPGPGNPVIPRRAEDWEPWKSILHELYITQNRILRDIIVIMETNYNVRATPKMYKNQFARWNFFKYAIKRRPRGRTQPGGGDPQETTTLVTSRRSPGTVEGLVSPLLYESSKARVMQAGMATVRDFLQVYINLDPTARDDKVVFGYEDPCFRYFKTSMDLFDQKENMHGGLLLRRAFLQIETMLSTMTIKAFSDLCFLVPHLLIESRRLDILGAYLRYLSGLAMAKFGNHPISDVVATLAELADEPDTLMRYIMALSEVNSDTLTNLGDAQERTRRWARYQYLACQKTDLDLGGASNDKDRKHAHHMLRVESQSVYWAQHLVMNDPESDKLAELWMVRDFPEDFVPRCEAYIAKAKALGESKLLPPGYARMMECLYIGWLNDYYETMEDWERVFEYGRRGLALAGGEQYQIWSIHLEGLMREHGSEKEAEELRKKRLAHQWFDEVREAVEKLTISLN